MSDKSPQAIDALTKDQIRHEIELGARSRFQRNNYAYLKVRLAQIEDEERAAQQEVDREYREREINLADDANEISRGANRRSTIAIAISVLALIIAIIAIFNE